MRTTKELRQIFAIVLGVLGAIALVCAIYLLLPATGAAANNEHEVQNARAQLKAEESQVTPLRGLDQKLDKSKKDISVFYEYEFPSHYSQITQTLNDLAAKNRVQLSNVTYKPEDAEIEDLQKVTMRATLSGRYSDVMRYIDAVDHARPIFLLDQVGVASQQSGEIQLQLTLETYMRGNAGQQQVPTT